MIKKQTKNPYSHLEKILTIAGLTLIAVGCIANLYGAYTNQRFIHDPIDLIYYFRYLILLGGGFAVGYLLTKRPTRRLQYNQLFLGVAYAVLTVVLFWLFRLAHFGLQNLFGSLSYPWWNIVFMGMPLLPVIIVVIVAYFSQYRSNRSDISAVAKMGIILSFTIYQAYELVSGAYYVITGAAKYGPNMSIWLIIGGYLTIPLVVATISYLVLNNIKKQFDRLFYAVLIGMIYSTLGLALWEFRTDASYEATNIFSSIVTALTILFAGVLLWQARKAVK